jgi:DNA-binding response OmpR family regulator
MVGKGDLRINSSMASNQAGNQMQINKVLLVDDDLAISKVAAVCLQKVGKWEVAIAASGQDALKLAQSFDPDLIVLDVLMPEMDGFEVLSRLREIETVKAIPVIFMTSLAQARDLTKCMSWGAKGVIPKPFNPMILPMQIQAILDTSENNARESA